MANLQQLETALRNAHAAGDINAAETIARAIQDADKPKSSASSGTVADALAQGVSFGFADELVGALNASIGTFDPTFKDTTWMERYRGNRDAARQNLSSYREHNPNLALAAEIGGGLLTGGVGAGRVAAAKTGSKLANTLRNVGTGAAAGGVYGAGASDADSMKGLLLDTGQGALVGGAAGGAITGLGLLGRTAAKKLVKPDASKLHNKSVDVLQDAGVPLTSGQKTGSDRLRAVETDLGSSVFGPDLDKVFGAQRQALQKTLMNKAGFESQDAAEGLITGEALANARQTFSQRYKNALEGVSVKLDSDKFIDKLASIENKHQKLLPRQQKKEVSDLIEELLDEATDPNGLSGESYQAIRSTLGDRQRAISNDKFSNLFRDMKRALDDAFTDAVDPSVAATKKQIDREFARFKQLETVYNRGGGKQVESGILPLASLNRESKKMAGDKPWREVVSSASRVLPDSIPNSGSAARMMNQLLPFGLLSKGMNTMTLGVPYAGQGLLAKGIGGNLGRAANQDTFRKLNQGGLLAVPGLAPLNVLDLQAK